MRAFVAASTQISSRSVLLGMGTSLLPAPLARTVARATMISATCPPPVVPLHPSVVALLLGDQV
jgi:hypothetical protein